MYNLQVIYDDLWWWFNNNNNCLWKYSLSHQADPFVETHTLKLVVSLTRSLNPNLMKRVWWFQSVDTAFFWMVGSALYRGEVFAYPLYLQKELGKTQKIEFVCTDVMCKYYPYLKRVCEAFPDLEYLLQMRPFLSVMHAKGHSTKCEVIVLIIYLFLILNT